MSDHSWFLFPKCPHMPPPDWQQLERSMLERQMILPASGQNIPPCMLIDLSMAIAAIPGASYLCHEQLTSAAEILHAHMAAGNIPATIPTSPHWTVEDAVQALQAHGIALGDAWKFSEHAATNWASPRYRIGPGMREFYKKRHYEYERRHTAITLFTTPADEPPFITLGGNTSAPCIPGDFTELEALEPFGTYGDFIGAASEDIAVLWINPDDGLAYHILDLDWTWGLGIGWNFMKFDGGGILDHDRFAAAIGELTGQPMLFANRHL